MHTTYRRKIYLSIFMILISFSLSVCAILKYAEINQIKNATEIETATVQTAQMQPQSRTPILTQTEPTQSQVMADTENQPMFVMRLVGNELRVFPYGKEDDYTVIADADPRTFRESDRLRLIDGVEIQSTEELAQLIEDFSS